MWSCERVWCGVLLRIRAAKSYDWENGGTFALIVPGQRGSKTGIPDVDVVLDRWSMRTPGIA